MKQSSYLLLFLVWHILKILWKSIHPFVHYVTTKNGSRIYKSNSWIQGVEYNIPIVFQIVPCLISDLSSKFHKIHWSVFYDKNNEKQSCVSQKFKSASMFQISPFTCTKSDQSGKYHENTFMRFLVMLLTDRQTGKQTRAKQQGQNITFAVRGG